VASSSKEPILFFALNNVSLLLHALYLI